MPIRRGLRLIEIYFAYNHPDHPTRQTIVYDYANIDGAMMFLESLLRCHCEADSKLYLCLKSENDPEILFDKHDNNDFREDVLGRNSLSSWPVHFFRYPISFIKHYHGGAAGGDGGVYGGGGMGGIIGGSDSGVEMMGIGGDAGDRGGRGGRRGGGSGSGAGTGGAGGGEWKHGAGGTAEIRERIEYLKGILRCLITR